MFPTIIACNELNQTPPMEEILGRGGFSTVYKTKSGRALKKIPKLRLEQENLIRLVENEVSIHAKCTSNPHIVQLLDWYEDEHYINIELELCEGGDCAQLLRDTGKLPEQQVIQYLTQLLIAVEYLHRNQHIHRDIKLSNMLLTKNNGQGHYIIKLADFGLATKVNGTVDGESNANGNTDQEEEEEEDLAHHTICGTKLCMAPEVFWGYAHGYPADIFSIGVVAYTMLVGKNPFQQPKKSKKKNNKNNKNKKDEKEEESNVFPFSSAMERVGQGNYTIPSFVSPEATDFIQQALCIDPSKRPKAIDLLQHALLTGQKNKNSSLRSVDQIVADDVAAVADVVVTKNEETEEDTEEDIDEVEDGNEDEDVASLLHALPKPRVRVFKRAPSSTTTTTTTTSSTVDAPFQVIPLSTKRLRPTIINVGRFQQPPNPTNPTTNPPTNPTTNPLINSTINATTATTTPISSTIEIVSNGDVYYIDGSIGLKMRVSSNGLSVVLQQQGARQWRYPLYELPLEHRDRYRFVCQAVSCIRSLTPKLIVNDFDSNLICTLMENRPFPLLDVKSTLDGGCVRINLELGIARIRVPVAVLMKDPLSQQNGDHLHLHSANRPTTGGVWYGVQLCQKVQNIVQNNNRKNSEKGIGKEEDATECRQRKMNMNLKSVDVDDSWLPNPNVPPGWDNVLASKWCTLTKTKNENNAADPGGAIGGATTSTTPMTSSPTTSPTTASYVLDALIQAQHAMKFCLNLSRQYEAMTAASTTIEGTHAADPFPVTLERSIYGNGNLQQQQQEEQQEQQAQQHPELYNRRENPLNISSSSSSSTSSSLRMTNADGTSSLIHRVGPENTFTLHQNQNENEEKQTIKNQAELKPIRIHGIGWVGRTKSGDLWLNLEDGIQMTLSSNGEELHYIDVCDQSNGPRIYKVNADLPNHVKKKLPFVAKAMTALRNQDGK